MSLDLSKPPFGGKPIDQEIRDNFNALKALFDGDTSALASIAADVSGLDTELSDLASLLSESYYTETETDDLLEAKINSSILTTVGDLLTKGSGGLQRFATGAVGTVLAGKGAGVLPEWIDHDAYAQVDFGTFSRTKDAASGNQLLYPAFEPDFMIFFASEENTASQLISIGISNGSSDCSIMTLSVSGVDVVSVTDVIRVYSDSSNYQRAYSLSLGSAYSTLSWIKGGSGTDHDVKGFWIAIGKD